MKHLIDKLDLGDFIASFEAYFARPKEFFFQGDENFFIAFLKELENISLPPLPKVNHLDSQLMLLGKFGILKLDEIASFARIISYFLALKESTLIPKEGVCRNWLNQIIIPTPLFEITSFFNQDGEIIEGRNLELDALKKSLMHNKKHISQQFSFLFSLEKLAPYCVDKQVHYIDGNECLLLRAGFNHALKGNIISRSQSGFFYLCPESILKLKDQAKRIEEQIENLIFEICKEMSALLQKHLPFLKFINISFDTLDHLNARSLFAKDKNLEFLFRTHTQEIILHTYAHPSLKNPKPLSINFSKNLLMITGVNAGGKTMLLKSLLSCAFLSKYLIPQKINASKSKIGYFKFIQAIISDPQSSKNDISTFAGRMLEISKILNASSMLLAIDEIELGTDADEASSLYKEILEHLLEKNNKIIITTHHKRLASIMATHPKVELYAATFDERNQMPTFDFLQGIIGKSYAFETAKRYNIYPDLIKKAKQHYGEDKEKLNALIEKSTLLELELKTKKEELQEEIQQVKNKKEELQEEIQKHQKDYQLLKDELQMTYQNALNALKKEAKTLSCIHQNMNQANKILSSQSTPPPIKKDFQIGESIKYHNQRGVIKAKNGDIYLIQCDGGMKIKVKSQDLKPSSPMPKPLVLTKIKVSLPKNPSGISLDLHGLRVEEALQKTDQFISDCLIAGYDQVVIYHGIGGGVLAKAVKDFLKSHPKVIKFEDAPPQMGGFGAKLVWL